MTTVKMSVSREPYKNKIPGNDGEAWANLYRTLVHVEYDEAQIADAVYKGHVIAPVLDGWRSYNHFICGQFIGIDLDTEDSRSAMSTLIDHDMMQMYGGVLYSTPSSKPTAPRTRAVHLLDKPITDVYQYKAAIRTVSRAYAGYDMSSAEPTRTFFGNYSLSKSHNVDGIWFSPSLLPLSTIEDMRLEYEAIDRQNARPTPDYTNTDLNLDKFIPSCISKAAPGNRNALCYWMACTMVEKGVPNTEQEQAVLQYAQAMDQDFTTQEALNCLRSARTGKGETT
jgi:hypothetical protein